jgi:glutamate-1-semialdehyde aminotransferase
MLTLFPGRETPVVRFEELDAERYGALFRGLLERGVYVAPSQYECLFPSLAHDDDVIEATIEAVSAWAESESSGDGDGNG